jgi:hypothetical protein
MFSDLFNFRGINWWTLVGGLGLNFVISTFTSLFGAYLATNESTSAMYGQFGILLMGVLLFIACGLAGFVIAKIADDVPIKHALWSSLGAVVPFLAVAVLSLNPMLFVFGGLAAAGNLNGGMMGTPKPHYRGPQK